MTEEIKRLAPNFKSMDHFTRELHWSERCGEGKFLSKHVELVEVSGIHDIFGIQPLAMMIRDYTPGGFILPLDIFQSASFSEEDVYRLICQRIDYEGKDNWDQELASTITDKKGEALKLTHLTPEASAAVNGRCVAAKVNCSYLGNCHQNAVDVLTDLTAKRFQIDRGEAWRYVMKIVALRYRKITMETVYVCFTPTDFVFPFILFADPSSVASLPRDGRSWIVDILVSGEIDSFERCLLPEMKEALYKAGIFHVAAVRLLSLLALRANSDVLRRLWLPMKYLLEMNTVVTASGNNHSVVRHEGKKKGYKVGIEYSDVKIVTSTGEYPIPIYRYEDGSSVNYITMLLASAHRFQIKGSVLRDVEGCFKESLGDWKQHLPLLQGHHCKNGEEMDDFILPGSPLLALEEK